MTASALLITVRLPDGRFHGMPEWPPSPLRLFQALIAGALAGAPRGRADELAPACTWFEGLPPPLIAAPPASKGCRSDLWVPNNDLDAVGGDPRHVSEIRTAKRVAPQLFAPDAPFLYLWPLAGEVDEHAAATVVVVAEQLYQFGRGIDMAYASAEVIPEDAAQARIATYHGAVHRPATQGEGGMALRCPTAGSFASLLRRHRAQRTRLRGGHLTQAPPAHFRVVPYNAQPVRLLFDLVAGDGVPRFARIPLTRVAGFVEQVRDRLAGLLARSSDAPLVERVVVGRGAGEADKAARLRIIPLPSIGSTHADRAIRRVLIEVPPDCPIPAREIAWAAGSVHLGADANGAIVDPAQPQLVRASEEGMLLHYGVRDAGAGAGAIGARIWRTVTPAALPVARRRGRIGGGDRAAGEAEAAHAVRQALRHAGVVREVETIHVQREPFERRGERADAFTPPVRFMPRGLHHIEIVFTRALQGPLVIGDARYLGLGLMRPVADTRRNVMVFSLPPTASLVTDDTPLLLRSVRRALMALSRDSKGEVPRLFSGHEGHGGPARSGRHEHVFLVADDANGDGRIDRLIIAAPWAGDRTHDASRKDRERFDQVVSILGEVRAGRLGVLKLSRLPGGCSDADPLIGPARRWEGRTLYRPTRHAGRRQDRTAAIERDLIGECLRRGLPRPEVEVLELEAGPRGGAMKVRARLKFAVGVRGPLLLGRDSHMGGGLFVAA